MKCVISAQVYWVIAKIIQLELKTRVMIRALILEFTHYLHSLITSLIASRPFRRVVSSVA